MYSAFSATSKDIVSATVKKMYVPVDGSILKTADLIGSVPNPWVQYIRCNRCQIESC